MADTNSNEPFDLITCVRAAISTRRPELVQHAQKYLDAHPTATYTREQQYAMLNDVHSLIGMLHDLEQRNAAFIDEVRLLGQSLRGVHSHLEKMEALALSGN